MDQYELLFELGTIMTFCNGLPAYQKEGSAAWDWWTSLDEKELQKPVWGVDKQGKPIRVRYAFKWTDEQVKAYYGTIATFTKKN